MARGDGRAAPYELVPRTVPGDVQSLLEAVGRVRGGGLSWHRLEAQQPQDGFARLGLHCVLCLDGPCRVSPFANGLGHEGAEAGICGMSGPAMSLAVLMRAVSSGMAALAPHLTEAALLLAAGELAGASAPGHWTAETLAERLFCVCSQAAQAIAAGKPAKDSVESEGQIPVGLGHLDPCRPRVLITGPSLGPSRALVDEIDGRLGEEYQAIIPAGAAGALVPGLPALIDGPSVELLRLARLISGTIEVLARGGLPEDTSSRLASAAAAFRARPWPGSLDLDDCTAARLAPWRTAAGKQLLIAGSGRARSPLGRGGLHQAVGGISSLLGWSPVGVGDAAFYLAQDRNITGLQATALPEAVRVALHPAMSRRRSGAGVEDMPAQLAVIFPEPVQHAELACALVLAAGGVPTHIAAEIPLGLASRESLTGAFGGLLSLGPPAEPAASLGSAGAVMQGAEQWLAGLPKRDRGAAGAVPVGGEPGFDG